MLGGYVNVVTKVVHECLRRGDLDDGTVRDVHIVFNDKNALSGAELPMSQSAESV